MLEVKIDNCHKRDLELLTQIIVNVFGLIEEI